MKRAFIGAVLALTLVTPVRGDDFVYHGSFLWNDVRSIVQKDHYLFCAFHDGIGVIDLDLDYNKKKIFSRLEIEGYPSRLHLSDNILLCENEPGTIALIDIENPADLKLMGTFTSEWEILDLALLDNYVYTAVEYDGLARYDITDPENIRFDDSSMAGIRVIALDVYDGRLYALDDYNGVLI